VLVTPHNNDAVPEVGKGENSSFRGEAAARDVNQDLEKQSTVGSDVLSNDPERMKEEQAAVKAQAAFRGYLVMLFLMMNFLCAHFMMMINRGRKYCVIHL
jgi:hypothetical protein